jgi:hypothetical protein
MDSNDEQEREIEFLVQRIEQLRKLQLTQKHLPFIGVHLAEHIDKLQARIDDIMRLRQAS